MEYQVPHNFVYYSEVLFYLPSHSYTSNITPFPYLMFQSNYIKGNGAFLKLRLLDYNNYFLNKTFKITYLRYIFHYTSFKCIEFHIKFLITQLKQGQNLSMSRI